MAAAASTTTTSVDASLWWDPFSLLLTDLENYSPSSSDLPPSLVKKLRDNHSWFLDTISRFKPPNEKSREALNSRQVNVGSHQLVVKPELREAVLKISSVLCLDEVQTYILVNRSMDQNLLAADFVVQEVLHVIILQYYIERQCLLKCTRQLIVHALNIGTPQEKSRVVEEETQKLIAGGLENQLLLVLQKLLSASYPDHMDGDLLSLWAEEILIEDNLILDILFLAYYESYSTCSGKQWRELCLIYERIITGSSNFPKLAISAEALQFINHVKVQLLLILIETLDLENLLQMVHDGTPFRTASASFSLSDIQDVDSIISNFNAFEVKEAGPLILAWAVFLCLISSLPKTQETNMLTDLDHVAYVRQSFEAAALNCVDEILRSDILKDSDGPFAGYRSVLRTFVSAFIASYEISLQLEDSTLMLILGILCKVYQGEESLCMQFWDKESFIDGPIRCLLCNLEGEFPYRTVELIRLLSALCEGTWPAECVYNFLDNSVGVSSLFEISNHSLIDTASQIVETCLPLRIPGVEGMVIPCNTRGHVLKVIDETTVLVRWEYAQSGVLILLLRLAQNLYLDSTVEVLATLNLLSRLVSFNMDICFRLLKIGKSFHKEATHMYQQADNFSSFNVVDIICNLVKKISPDRSGALMMSMSVNILSNMLKCFPSHVIAAVVNMNIFDVALRTNPFNVRFDGILSGSWLLSGRLANLILIDCEHNDSCCALTLSVLDFTMQLVESEVVNDVVLALLVFSLQYVFVNHTYWKYKVKRARWKVSLKVLEVINKCISSIPYCGKMGEAVRDMLFCDSSIHSTLFRIVCTTSQDLEKLYISRLYEMTEIEGIQLSISAAMDILRGMLSNLSQDLFPSLPVFHQTVLSSATKPIPVINAMISLLSCFRSPKIQVGAAKVLSILFGLADSSQSFVSGNACFGLDEKQITHLRQSISIILCEESSSNEDLIVATLNVLAAATHYQPAFLVALIAAKGNTNDPSSYANGVKLPNETDELSSDSMEPNIMVAVVKLVMQSGGLFSSEPHILLAVLNFLEGLWRGGAQFTNILVCLRNSDHIWRQMSKILQNVGLETNLIRNSREMDIQSIAYRCQCQSSVLQILAYESFLQKKLLLAKHKIENNDVSKPKDASLLGLKDALLTLHESSILGDLIKSYASCGHDNNIYLRGKSAAALLSVHMMEKLKTGDIGCLSVSLTEKIYSLLSKLTELSAFSELVAQYAKRGYSEGNKLQCLILQDLYYHLEGELEGREVAPGPFKELCQYLLRSDLWKVYQHKYEGDLFVHGEMVYLFDLSRLRTDLGLHIWDYSQWKASKTVAESMLLCLEDVNSMLILASSSLSALKSLTTILITIMEDSGEIIGKTIQTQLIISSIDQVCHCLQDTIDLLAPRPDASDDIIISVEAQAELLLHLVKYADKNLSSPTCVFILKTSGSGLKLLSDLRGFLSGTGHAMKLLLMLFLSSIKSSCGSSGSSGIVEMECVDACADACNLSLGQLPILCNCIESDELCTLSLTIIDFILKGFTMPNSWLPIIKKHLNLQHLILKLRDKSSLAPIILKFLLTLASVRDGAAMLFTAGFLPSLSTLFGELAEGNSLLVVKGDKKECVWQHGLAVIVAMIHSLQDTPFCADIVEYVIMSFFLEKVELISYYLTIPDFTDYDEKKAWTQKKMTSLSALKDKENTLLLICELAKHSNLWMKFMNEIDSELRERNIHLLAFISRGNQSFRENPLKIAPLVCQPIFKEEFELFKKPSFVNSRRGWFGLSSLGRGITPVFTSISSKATALVGKDQESQTIDPASQTYFSDTIAIQIYRIALLILKFLCLQAESAVKRAEEVGFVDLVHFPELPMPEILHGLQDQGILIVTELCEANKMKQVQSEVQSVCVLLVRITEMSLHLEFCVSQICGISPVSGHVEDFSKKLRLLFKATEGHAFLKGLVQSLRNIVAYVYPGLLQTEGFL